MNYYNILGVKEDASKEEIKEAYEKQVKKFKEEVQNEKKAKAFLKLFDEAYEALMNMDNIPKKEVNEDKTVIIKPQEIQQELEKQRRVETGSKSKESRESRDIDKTTGGRSSKRKSSNINTGKRKDNNKSNDNSNSKSNDKKDKYKEKRQEGKDVKETANDIFSLLMIPVKIIALPIIAILTVIILVLKAINIISWIATKGIMVGSIAAVSIHLYQVHMGQLMDNRIFIIAGIAFIASFFLPYILKFVLLIFESINDMLKNFAF